MKVDTASVKKGAIIQVDTKLYRILDVSHTHTGRGGATYTFKAYNIIDGGNQLLTYKSGTVLEKVDVQTLSAIYLYTTGAAYTFMENDTSTMHEIPAQEIEDVTPYLKENLDCYLMIFEGRVIGVILPTTVEYTITDTVPGVKGDRASAGRKPATLENGLEVQVPLHLEAGAIVKVNTQTGEIA